PRLMGRGWQRNYRDTLANLSIPSRLTSDPTASTPGLDPVRCASARCIRAPERACPEDRVSPIGYNAAWRNLFAPGSARPRVDGARARLVPKPVARAERAPF